VVAALPFSRTLINQNERDVIAEFGRTMIGKLAAFRSTSVEPAEASHAI
jgi:hypothetical protein